MTRSLVGLLVLGLPGIAEAAPAFTYNPPGQLVPGSGSGAAETTVFAPGMRFPIEAAPAFANSQVWGNGGSQGGGGGQCDDVNYAYPWHDNYCETRTWPMPLCPAGEGHQGQDIRPATCIDGVHSTVASEAGTVTNVGNFSVYVTAADGTRFDYLHGTNNAVSLGDEVDKGQRINAVSNAFNGTPTTIHLHFNIFQDVAGVGTVYVSPYMSLVESYEELLGIERMGVGKVDSTDCAAIVGWAQDDANPDDSVTVYLYFDGSVGDPQATIVEVVADRERAELCDLLGSCAHGFEVEVPLSLRDDTEHSASLYAVPGGRELVEIEASPTQFNCPPPPVPHGVRRPIGPDELARWGFSAFWDVAAVGDAALSNVPLREPFPTEPVLVRDDAGALWLIDPGSKREVSPAAADAWALEPGDAPTWPQHVLDDLAVGPPLPDAPFLASGDGPQIFVIDADPDLDGGGTAGTATDGAAGTASATTEGDAGGADGADSPATDGCGCRPTRPKVLHAVVALVALAWRRRRLPEAKSP